MDAYVPLTSSQWAKMRGILKKTAPSLKETIDEAQEED
jgi:hypothetical protein